VPSVWNRAGLTYLLCSYYGLMFGILVLIVACARAASHSVDQPRWSLAGLIAALGRADV
jgi:hypothetical protein